MLQALDILKVAHRNAVDPTMNLLHIKEQFIPGSIQYVIRRYYPTQNWQSDDTGMLVYHYNSKKAEENFLELRFCISGNKYCSGKHDTVDVFSFHFSSTFLHQFVHNVKLSNRKDEVLAFKHPNSFTK